MRIEILPPLAFVEGYPFEQTIVWRDEITGLPVDFTEVINGIGWTGRFTISEDLNGPVLYEAVPVLNAIGEIYIAMAASDFAFLTPPPQIGGGPVGVYQLQLNAPLPQMTQVFQGPVFIAGII